MYNFAIDRGGTFTDVYAQLPSGEAKVLKEGFEPRKNIIELTPCYWMKKSFGCYSRSIFSNK